MKKLNGRTPVKGFTLVELAVVLTIVAVIATFAIPQFQKAIEQSRIDLASTNLKSVWTAQRIYFSENKTFAQSLKELENAGFLSDGFAKSINKTDGPFIYAVEYADSASFEASAERLNSNVWKGTVTIDEQGELDGSIKGRDTLIEISKVY